MGGAESVVSEESEMILSILARMSGPGTEIADASRDSGKGEESPEARSRNP